MSFSASIIKQDTIRAYLGTHYRVEGDMPMTLIVGEANLALASLHKANQVESSAFITACNPFSQVCDDAANAGRQEALALEIRQRSLAFLEGVGEHPSNRWPGEASFLVLGLSLEAANALEGQNEQNAIIWRINEESV